MIEICTIGGYEEVGKNMTAVKIKNDVFIFDAGIYLPAVIEIQEEEAHEHIYNEKNLRRIGRLFLLKIEVLTKRKGLSKN